MATRKRYNRQMSIPIEKEYKEALARFADEDKSTPSQLARLAIREYVEKRDAKTNEKENK